MFKKILTCMICFGLSTPALADSGDHRHSQVPRDLVETGTHSLGFAAGSTYGIGLSYSRDWSAWGFQVTALPVWDADNGGMLAGGLNIKRNFHSNGMVGVYGSLGVAGMLSRDVYEECDWNEDVNEDENCETIEETSQNFAAGPGVGMEFLFWKNVLFRFELPLAVRNGTDGFGITPIPNVALMYRWK